MGLGVVGIAGGDRAGVEVGVGKGWEKGIADWWVREVDE